MTEHKDRIETLLADDSFVRWIEGKASDREASEWKAWLQDDPARKKLVKDARTIHTSLDFKRSGNLSTVEAELSKLGRSIDQHENQKASSGFTQKRKGNYSRVAAVITLLITVLAVSLFFYFGSDPREEAGPALLTTHTEYGQKKNLTLSDGSTIALNANSSLTYPSKRTGGDLEVRLKGEAYFDIVRKSGTERRTFTVYTPDGKVEVLGTKFNVNTYRSGTEVVLEEGKVRVELRDTHDQLKDTYVMEAGELGRFAIDGESIQISKINPELYTCWTQNKLMFDRTPLAEIAERIEHIYGIRFPVSEPRLRQIRISGSVPNDNLPVLLNALGKMLERPLINDRERIHLGPPRVKQNQE